VNRDTYYYLPKTGTASSSPPVPSNATYQSSQIPKKDGKPQLWWHLVVPSGKDETTTVTADQTGQPDLKVLVLGSEGFVDCLTRKGFTVEKMLGDVRDSFANNPAEIMWTTKHTQREHYEKQLTGWLEAKGLDKELTVTRMHRRFLDGGWDWEHFVAECVKSNQLGVRRAKQVNVSEQTESHDGEVQTERT
jgi:hypothetical protein